jgi:transcriptional regulator with XRE-family HTH domain
VQIPRLREWREARALTQVELAERAGVSSRSVAGYEAGAGARPPTVRRLAEALEVEIADLVGGPGSPKAPRRSALQASFNDVLAEERQGRRPWRSEAEEFIRQNEGLLSDPELTYVVSSKLCGRSVDRLAEVNEAIRAADRDENFPLTELNEMERAFDIYQRPRRPASVCDRSTATVA